MADDAAGAVRRTPRPAAKPPAAWWSPTEGFWSTNDGPVEGLRVLDFADEFRAYPPNDAVQLVGPDQRRPVVLLRADDCDCGPPYADCPHGPEPVDALDLAVWLHAELQHKLTLPCGECHACMNWADETWRRAGRKPPAVVTWEDKLAENRYLDARLDDAIKLIEEMAGHLRQDAALTIGVETRLAVLQGDQPTEPTCIYVVVPGEGGRCITPAVHDGLCAEHLAVVETEKAQHVYEDDAAHNWAGICRVCSYPPGGPQHLVAPAEPTGEADRA